MHSQVVGMQELSLSRVLALAPDTIHLVNPPPPHSRQLVSQVIVVRQYY